MYLHSISSLPAPYFAAAPLQIERPGGGTYELPRYERRLPQEPGLAVATGPGKIFMMAPPNLPFDADNDDAILQILEYAGLHYLTPASDAAREAAMTYRAALKFALSCDFEWVGFDWDFTADLFRIYGDIWPLITMRLSTLTYANTPPPDSGKVRVWETAKPGVHELIIGFAAGFALRQGLTTFLDWDRYQPQVRIVTQTWAERLSVLGSHHIRLVPLLMGEHPGPEVSPTAIRQSDAFMILDDFFRYASSLLVKLERYHYDLAAHDPSEQKDIQMLVAKQAAHKIKPYQAFKFKGWSGPHLIFDDSRATGYYLQQSGARVITTINPITPDKELSDLAAIGMRGRHAAARHVVRSASQSEAPALREALRQISQGAEHVVLKPEDLRKTPDGSVIILHDMERSLAAFCREFEVPKQQMKRRLSEIEWKLLKRGHLS